MNIDCHKLKLKLAQDYQSDSYKRQLELYSYVKTPLLDWKAVAVCLIVEDSLFFIKRKTEMPTHPDQVAMVGGLSKSGETSPWEVGCREFFEETSLPSHQLEFLGVLPAAQTAGERLLLPVMARWKGNREDFVQGLQSNGEWDSAFLIKLENLADENFWNHALYHGRQEWRSNVLFFALTNENAEVVKGKNLLTEERWPCLWGASARVIWNLFRIYYS